MTTDPVPPAASPRRLIIAITGATGAVYGVRLLEMLGQLGVQTHLVVSSAGWMSVEQEMDDQRKRIESLATRVHSVRDVGASIASGSFQTDGMVIAPCSMRTLAAVAIGLGDNLITRAADVVLKERRRLVLMVRETPLNLAHLRNMTAITEMGGIVFPPLPAFYQRPASVADIVDDNCCRVLDLFSISHPAARRWQGRRTQTLPDARGAAAASPNDHDEEHP